ncbi:MAG: EAL domain-containing protein, partial [Pseudomonadota bacterium]
YTREQLLHMGPQDVLPMAREEIGGDYDEVIAAGDKGLRHERRFVRSDASEGWTELHRRALRTEDGTLIVTIGRDITERKQADDRIRRLNRVFAMLSGINAAIVRIRDRAALLQEVCRIVVDSGRLALTYVCVVDPAEQQLTPVASAGADGGFLERIRNRMSLRDDAPEGLGPAARAVKERRAVVVNDVENDPRIRHKKEHRERGIHSVAILPLFVAGEPTGVLGLHSAETGFFDEEEMKLLIELAGDISFALDHIEKANRLDYLAYYDSLTGLANRTLFLERLNRYTDAAGPVGEKLALVVADIERLRTINESLGRQAGDALLKQLAERLARGTGRGQLARIGADIFVVVLLAVRGKSEVTRRIERIWHDCFSESFRLGESEVRISAKAGAAVFPNDGADAESLLTNAEAALRRAKTTGERHVFHALEMTEKTAEKLTLENRLRQALEKSEFVLHYQPKVDLESRRIVGVEALIRWQSPELGLVPPMKFIPLMEETGLILPVGSWALKRASHDHRSWVNQGLKAPRVAVNVSPIQLRQRDFVGGVEQAIIEGVAPTGIDLEITESLIMEDIQGNIEKLKAVRQLGVQIAIDDFGTGYSSLGYLAKLPVQLLKIDRSFIITMLNDPNHMTLVQTIISLAHSLKLKVVAEGVDSEEQAKLLRLLRCDEMQGYLFSKPLPFEQMTALLEQEKKT